MKRVLVTPLDWGLGHATRCVPVIHELLKRKCTVFIAGFGDSLALLKNEFPLLDSFILHGYHPIYPEQNQMVWKMALQVPKFLQVINREHSEVEAIVTRYKIDLIISDNRYGCWSQKVPSIIITHQLNILMPKGFGWMAAIVRSVNYKLIKKFSWCWVPDYSDKERSLSGKLSEYDPKLLSNVVHIGPLSRFKLTEGDRNTFDLACILSGPEPQRTIFANVVIPQLKASGLRYFIVHGKYFEDELKSEHEAAILNTDALQTVISRSTIVITRSGYSTIMDLAAIGKKGIMVPTPGQTEQEYLAHRYKTRRILMAMNQDVFDLKKALAESKSYTGFTIDGFDGHSNSALLVQAVDHVLQ
ncbi:glycosyltransferase [Chryseolinea sp. H1M3-3]|uniref:glycosyltransferase n=1 Tax=Chryseolinea sp. H1M3-3 TaxID=3034144 RepID=UPI0023ED67C0|nr:glycosyltransferase [Chryseolinea sp. H1M3-3]